MAVFLFTTSTLTLLTVLILIFRVAVTLYFKLLQTVVDVLCGMAGLGSSDTTKLQISTAEKQIISATQ